MQRIERGRGEFGRAGEGESHGVIGSGPAWRSKAAGAALHRGALLLLHPGGDALLLQPRQVIDEDLAVEVVDLVLYTYGEQAFGFELERLALRIERADFDALR